MSCKTYTETLETEQKIARLENTIQQLNYENHDLRCKVACRDSFIGSLQQEKEDAFKKADKKAIALRKRFKKTKLALDNLVSSLRSLHANLLESSRSLARSGSFFDQTAKEMVPQLASVVKDLIPD